MPIPTSKTSVVADHVILDTGPLVALLSKQDDAHAACVAVFESLRGQLITTDAVLTEAMHLVRRQPRAHEVCLDFFIRGGALLVAMTPARLAVCKQLVARYRDVPMDFADAALVALADDLEIEHVFTLDRRGFETYRWRRTRRFKLLP